MEKMKIMANRRRSYEEVQKAKPERMLSVATKRKLLAIHIINTTYARTL